MYNVSRCRQDTLCCTYMGRLVSKNKCGHNIQRRSCKGVMVICGIARPVVYALTNGVCVCVCNCNGLGI